MIGSLISSLMILFFGILYPGYASYKAICSRNADECMKWLKYWIVYAGFTCIATMTDVLLFWFPLYYEIKVMLVFALISPTIEGSSTLFTKIVQPTLQLHEDGIDEYLKQAHAKGYSAFLELGSKGASYVAAAVMQSAINIIQIASSWAAGIKSNSRNQLTSLQEDSSRSSSLSDIESYCKERIIITELTGDDEEEVQETNDKNKSKTSTPDGVKLARAVQRAKISLDNSKLLVPCSWSSCSIDNSPSSPHKEKPIKKTKATGEVTTKASTTSTAVGKPSSRCNSKIRLHDANRECAKSPKTSPLWMS